ncbi:MAG: sodium:proton antiporter, partial [Pseudomonadota bacterium]
SFFKAPSIEKMVRSLKIDALLSHEQLSYFKSKAIIYHEIANRIEDLFNHHEITRDQYERFKTEYQRLYQQVSKQCRETSVDSSHVVENILRIYTLSLQKTELIKMFRRHEITESVYTRNLNILETQTEKVEKDKPKIKSINTYLVSWFDGLNKIIHRLLFLPFNKEDKQELYLYYRTQHKLISKVLHDLYLLENSPLIEIFDDPQALQSVISIYKDLKTKAVQAMQHELSSNQALLDELNEQSAKALFQTVQNDKLKELRDNEIITGKLYARLSKELND